MNRKMRKKERFLMLCRKYGYNQTVSVLKLKIERARRAQTDNETPILHNLTQQEDAPK